MPLVKAHELSARIISGPERPNIAFEDGQDGVLASFPVTQVGFYKIEVLRAGIAFGPPVEFNVPASAFDTK